MAATGAPMKKFAFLHFNVCYYATIEHCIDAGLQRFEPGAGGEFKWLRGFDAEETRSMHWFADPRLGDAVSRFLVSERGEVERVIAGAAERSPLRKAGQPTVPPELPE